MFYNIFLEIMSFLERTFGYVGAIRIKDSADYVVGVLFGAFVLIWLMADFYLHVDIGEDLPPNVAIVKAGDGEEVRFYTNPQRIHEVVESFVGYIILRRLPHEDTIRFRNLKIITFVLTLIMALLFLTGVLMSFWDYLPRAGH